MPTSSSRSKKTPAKTPGQARKTASTKKKSASATKKTATAKRTTKSRRAAAEAPAEPAVAASTELSTPESSVESPSDLPVLEVAKTTSLLPSATTMVRGGRRAVFIDVENTSSEEALLAALEQLAIDRQMQPTEVVAVGNWRVISHQVARMLAQRGARLHHSAPATGVKDWSDLSIAVHAGIWLGRSSPGDVIEIVSADRAFDAVADASMSLGVVFRRWTYGAAKRSVEEGDADAGGRRRRSRRGRRGRRPDAPPAAATTPSPSRARAAPPPRAAARPQPPPPPPHPAEAAADDEDRHSASHQQIIAAIARLTSKDPRRGVNLDLLINALKNEGFSRPPGSPRLVTRLRKMKDVEVSSTGMVRLTGEAAPGLFAAEEAAREEPSSPEPSPVEGSGEADSETAEVDAPPATPKKRASGRRGTRGGARRSRSKKAAEKAPQDEGAEPPADVAAQGEPVSRSA